MNNVVIFDTSVFIDYLRTGRQQQLLESVTGLIRTSSVVLSELWRGATKPQERDFIRALQKNHPILTPTTDHWLEAGQALACIYADRGFAPNKLRDLHFDVLIALTARTVGGRLITRNRAEFEIISDYMDIRFEIW